MAVGRPILKILKKIPLFGRFLSSKYSICFTRRIVVFFIESRRYIACVKSKNNKETEK